MKNKVVLFLVLFAAFAFFSGCTDELKTEPINEELLIGRWVEDTNSQLFWRYDRGYTGETWDESEDVHEGEGTKFNWSVDRNLLQIDLYGEMGQHAYYDYTVTYLADTLMRWKDLYGNTKTFIKQLI